MTTVVLLTNQTKKEQIKTKYKEGNTKNQIEINETDKQKNREQSMEPHPEYVKKSKIIKKNFKDSK